MTGTARIPSLGCELLEGKHGLISPSINLKMSFLISDKESLHVCYVISFLILSCQAGLVAVLFVCDEQNPYQLILESTVNILARLS